MAEAQANIASFQAALSRSGFTMQAQEAVVSQGFVNIALLGLVTSDQIKELCKLIREDTNNPVPINMLQQQMLLAMRYWVVNRQRLGLLVIAALGIVFTLVLTEIERLIVPWKVTR
jgi:hypothetical protein